MIHKYLIAVAMLGLSASAGSAQSVRSGIEAWQHADYARAVEIWRPLAERGDADAAFNLGQAYRLGRGVTTNLAAAQTWFERAAAKGHVDAQTTLGLMLFENGDRPAGVRWLRQAAEKGEARALLVYGTALFNGDGVKQDPILGYAYVSRAAAQGLAPAQATIDQLNQILPLEQRKKALTIAMAKAKAAPPPNSKPVRIAAKSSATTGTSAKPAKSTPPVVAPPSPAIIAATGYPGKWRVQLGAFSKQSSAETYYKGLSNLLPDRHPYYVTAGAVTRLQVGPFSTQQGAVAMCSFLAQRGHACFPVPAK